MIVENSKNNIQKPSYASPFTTKPRRGDDGGITFTGPLDGVITQSLITIDTNPMINAALLDVFSMVIPRTYVDTKKRNKYAGAETLFRELTGTFIVCLSSGILAKGIAHLYNKFVNPEIQINPNSWVSNDSLNLLHHSWNKNKNSDIELQSKPDLKRQSRLGLLTQQQKTGDALIATRDEKYVSDILSNLSGTDGHKTSKWQDIDWKKAEWYDDAKWNKFEWQNAKFDGVQHKLKDDSTIIKTLAQALDGNVDSKDAKQLLQIIEHRVTNALKVGGSVNVELDGKTLSTSLHNLLRDTYDLGKNVFKNKNINVEAAINKLTKMNKVKTLGALSVASILGLTNQYINRLITKKRTGSDAFVGEIEYKKKLGNKNSEQPKENRSKLWALKFLASGGIIALAAIVMKIKNPKDFIKQLEFTSAITSGNAIKTVYTATLVGRFLAAKNETELRESATRDYLGFLNWLVFGSFVAKGVANLLDRGRNNLFNIKKEGKGVRHWLNDLSLKSHAEIASKGEKFAKKNIWKLNLAHASGLLYSTLALGVLLPMLNILVTQRKHKERQKANSRVGLPSHQTKGEE